MRHRQPGFQRLALLLMLLPGLTPPESLLAQPLMGESGAIELDAITVKGDVLHRNDIPTTVNRVNAEQFEDMTAVRTEEILEDVPGVEIGNYNMGGVANVIKMRGFDGGAHGGDIAIYVDGIPLNEGESHADGYADINVLIPLEIEKLDVFKGPSSVLYGNFARAGALAFHTRQRGEYSKAKLSFGSFDTWDAQGAFGLALAPGVYNNTAIQGARTDGFQDNSAWSRINASTRFTWDINAYLDVALSVRAHESDWDAPGYIPRSLFDAETTRQAPNAEDDGGHKRFYSERFDLGLSLTDDLRLLYWAYATQQDFTRFAKFGYEPGGQTERFYDRHVWGTGTSLNLDTLLAEKPFTGILGLEYYNEDTDWRRWDTFNRVRLDETQDRAFNITTLSAFAQGEWELSRYFRPTLGVRYDRFGGSYDNRDPGTPHFDQDMHDYSHWSPKLGFRSLVLDGLDLRASYSEGFALPDGEAKYQSDPTVSPETIKQYEIGLTYDPSELLLVDIAAFILDTENEIQEYPIDSGVYRNLGETRRTGIEAAVELRPIDGLTLSGDIALINSEIRNNSDPALDGKEIAGIPGQVSSLMAEYRSPRGFGGKVKWRHVGSYYIDDINTESYEGYDVVDLGVSYQRHFGGEDARKLRLAFEVKNVFDEWYSQAVWSGYGTTNYAVSWPRTYWVSMNLDW
jgi:outer membrane receptor protein involved in Fe transport